MSNGAFNAKQRYQARANLLRPIDLENALLFCNHVLDARRGEECAPAIQQLTRELRLPPAAFLVHLAARQILLQSLGASNRGMGTEDFKRVIGLLWKIIDHDPAMEDPGWKNSDPTGWAVRYLGLQERPVDIMMQNYGLAAALFTEEMPVASGERINTPARLENL